VDSTINNTTVSREPRILRRRFPLGSKKTGAGLAESSGRAFVGVEVWAWSVRR